MSKAKPNPGRGRKPGRPPKMGSRNLTREAVIKRGMELAADMPMDEISIVRLARELAVTPALIHYYLDGGRDALTSGIINRFYGEVLSAWPRMNGTWRELVTQGSRHVYGKLIRFPGIATYLKMHNRFRVFQLVRPGERDNGVLFLEKFIDIMSRAQLSDERTGIVAHLLLEFLLGSAHDTAHYRWPREHVNYLEKQLAALDPDQFPNLVATGYLVGKLDSEQAFDNGLRIYLDGIERERDAPGKAARKAARKKSGQKPGKAPRIKSR